jgi:hypothetical protein
VPIVWLGLETILSSNWLTIRLWTTSEARSRTCCSSLVPVVPKRVWILATWSRKSATRSAEAVLETEVDAVVGALDDEAVVPVLEPVAGAVDAVPACTGPDEDGPDALPELTLFDGALFDGALFAGGTAPASGSADGSASVVLSAGTLPVDVLPDGALDVGAAVSSSSTIEASRSVSAPLVSVLSGFASPVAAVSGAVETGVSDLSVSPTLSLASSLSAATGSASAVSSPDAGGVAE